MKISETTSFPHPVLAPWLSDIGLSTISTDITFREEREKNEVAIHCKSTMDQPEILRLIQEGRAAFGCYIWCKETGLRRLQHFGFPSGTHHFAPGAFLGNVHVRPMVWTLGLVSAYRPAGAHPEFSGSFELQPGEILALDDEQIIRVTRPPLPSVESIFEIISSEEIAEGRFEVDAESDRITVRMGPTTYHSVQSLRQTDDVTRAVLMNSLYVPIVMQVLQELSGGYERFEQFRWLHPFRARCEQAGIQINSADLLSDAQRLLDQPFRSLMQMIDKEESDDATT